MSRLQTYLTNEEYFSRAKLRGKSYEIFTNPSRKEMNEFDSIRWIADLQKKTVFIWDAWGPLHDEIWGIRLDRDFKSDIMSGKIVAGVAEKISGKWTLIEYDGDEHMIAYIDDLNPKQIVDYTKKTKWIDKYLNFTGPFKESMIERGKWPGPDKPRRSILDIKEK